MIPAAGLGTRFLPATKSVPKELFPIGDRPAIQIVIDEATGFLPLAGVIDLAQERARLTREAEKLESEIGKPVISSNTATAWHCLRLAGYDEEVPGFGELFRRPLRPDD